MQIISVILVIVCVGCTTCLPLEAHEVSKFQDPILVQKINKDLRKVIFLHLGHLYHLSDGNSYLAFSVIGVEHKGSNGTFRAYLNVLREDFYQEGNKLQYITGSTVPVALDILDNKVMRLQAPGNMHPDSPDFKTIFPAALQGVAKKVPANDLQKMKKDIDSQIRNKYKNTDIQIIRTKLLDTRSKNK